MRPRLVWFLGALAIAGWSALVAHGVSKKERSTPAERARSFLAALTPALRGEAVAPFDDMDRENWHYVPRRRPGVSIKQLDARQRTALEAWLASLLTADGLRKAKGVITLEGVLVELGANPRFRDDGLYFVRIFGDPAGVRPWGLRFEGHHLSLNYTSQDGASFAGTPAFFGANPHRVPRGEHKGMRLLAREEDDARALVRSLSDKQRKRALLAGRAPAEIVTGAQRRARLDKFSGIPASALTEQQQKKLRGLVELYARNHRRAVADFVALAPDALFPVGGYPGNDEDGKKLQRSLDRAKIHVDMLNSAKFVQAHEASNGKLGVTGFCFGGGVSNYLAVEMGEGLQAAAPFYGRQPDLKRVGEIRADVMIHYAENDPRVNEHKDAYDAALTAAGVNHESFLYPGTRHGFHNDSTPRYDAEAAALAWKRTIELFQRRLG